MLPVRTPTGLPAYGIWRVLNTTLTSRAEKMKIPLSKLVAKEMYRLNLCSGTYTIRPDIIAMQFFPGLLFVAVLKFERKLGVQLFSLYYFFEIPSQKSGLCKVKPSGQNVFIAKELGWIARLKWGLNCCTVSPINCKIPSCFMAVNQTRIRN